jgi:hypothetical protein
MSVLRPKLLPTAPPPSWELLVGESILDGDGLTSLGAMIGAGRASKRDIHVPKPRRWTSSSTDVCEYLRRPLSLHRARPSPRLPLEVCEEFLIFLRLGSTGVGVEKRSFKFGRARGPDHPVRGHDLWSDTHFLNYVR